MKTIAKNVKLKVSGLDVTAEIRVNEKGNLEVIFSDDDLKKFPNGYSTEGFNEEVIFSIFK
jgi:hypothetical protein